MEDEVVGLEQHHARLQRLPHGAGPRRVGRQLIGPERVALRLRRDGDGQDVEDGLAVQRRGRRVCTPRRVSARGGGARSGVARTEPIAAHLHELAPELQPLHVGPVEMEPDCPHQPTPSAAQQVHILAGRRTCVPRGDAALQHPLRREPGAAIDHLHERQADRSAHRDQIIHPFKLTLQTQQALSAIDDWRQDKIRPREL